LSYFAAAAVKQAYQNLNK